VTIIVIIIIIITTDTSLSDSIASPLIRWIYGTFSSSLADVAQNDNPCVCVCVCWRHGSHIVTVSLTLLAKSSLRYDAIMDACLSVQFLRSAKSGSRVRIRRAAAWSVYVHADGDEARRKIQETCNLCARG